MAAAVGRRFALAGLVLSLGGAAAWAQQADLSVNIVGPSTVTAGMTITYTITVTNSGPNDAVNVNVSDTLPAGITFASFTQTSGPTAAVAGGGTSSASWGTLINGATAVFSLVGTVDPTTSSGTVFSNTATVASGTTDPNGGNNVSTAATTVNTSADLAITKTALATVAAGSNITYTITVTNNGPSTASSVSWSDVLPAGLTFVSLNQSTGPTASSVSGGTTSIVTWASLASGASATFSLVATVSSSTPNNTVLSNTANVTATTSDPNSGNNAWTATTTVQDGADLAVTKTAPATVVAGNNITYTLTVTNNGPIAAASAQLSDALPAGESFVSFTQTSGPAAVLSGGTTSTASWSSLANGASATFQLVAFVSTSASVGTIFSNTANVSSSTTDPNTANNAFTASTMVSLKGSTSSSLTSSLNPSFAGQSVTFTDTVAKSSGAGTPTGTVTFKDGGGILATVALSGATAAFTTSTLSVGSHTITATYNGDSNFVAGTSPALVQTVQVSLDSVRLRALQLEVTTLEAQASGAAFGSAVSNAIEDGFSDGGGNLIAPAGSGMHFNFAADAPPAPVGGHVAEEYDPVMAAHSSVMGGGPGPNQLPASLRGFAPDTPFGRPDDAFGGMAYASPLITKAPPRAPAPKEWLAWADVRATGWNTDAALNDIHGGQVNALVGLTRRVTPDFLIGVLGGYENFDYSSETLNGRLKGDGYTAGAYLGWRLAPGLRFEAAGGYAQMSYNGVSGLASATFPGSRWLASGGLVGTTHTTWLEIEPSAKVDAIWESDKAYTDSLGTAQADNNFAAGRASSGIKVAHPFLSADMWSFAPYVGAYADYYFTINNSAPLLLPPEFVQGWSARLVGGFKYAAPGGTNFQLGSEVGGLGSASFTTWSVKARAAVPF